MKARFCFYLLLALAVASPTAFAASKGGAKAFMDEGRLERAWFSADAEFREGEDVDYLWVTPGFELDGKSLQFMPWPKPKFIGEDAEDRDGKDMRLASDMSENMAEIWKDSFDHVYGDRVTTSFDKGEIRVEGRVVDCSTGNEAAKFWVGMGAGSGSTTYDVRFVDAQSGAVLAGIHHRSVSASTWDTTEERMLEGVEEVLYEIAEKGLQKVYAKGDRKRD